MGIRSLKKDRFTVKPVTENVIMISKESAGRADPFLTVKGQHYNLFRSSWSGEMVYIKGAAKDLNDRDNVALNTLCEGAEKSPNRIVKRDIGFALRRYFNERIHINEFGCGRFPIGPHLPQGFSYVYHGIDKDPKFVADLTARHISASSWTEAMAHPKVSPDLPTVAVAVYALHFIANAKLPGRIRAQTNDKGFFVGNLYINPAEARTRETRDTLKKIFDHARMPYINFRDPTTASNEYWIAGRAMDATNIHEFANVMKSTVLVNSGLKPQVA